MKENVHGGDIYRFGSVMDYSSNCNPFGVPAGVAAAIREATGEIAHYPDVRCGALRRAVAEALGVREDWLFFGNGAAEVIFAIAMGLRPKKALLLAPTFAEYEQALQLCGCQCAHYFLREADGFAAGEALMEALTADTDILFLCNPNNPTGVTTEKPLLLRLLRRCRELGITMVVDECFLDFVAQKEKLTLLSALADFPNLIILKAFTKLYAMAGVRLGYCVCADCSAGGRIERIEGAVQPWNVSSLAQAAGIAALKETAYVARSLAAITEEKQYLQAGLQQIGLPVYGSEANYLFFRGDAALGTRLLQKGILVRDCRNYLGLAAGYYRIAVRLRPDNEKLLAALRVCCTAGGSDEDDNSAAESATWRKPPKLEDREA